MIDFSKEQILIADVVKEFTKKEIEPRDKWMDENGFDYELNKKIAKAGIYGINIPLEYGGAGANTVTTCMVMHELCKGSASIGVILSAHWMASTMILNSGTQAQKEKYLPMAAEGKIFAFGLSESFAGSDAAGIRTVAKKEGDKWILNGSKAWITNSGVADVYIILAKTDQSKGSKGISAFIIEDGTEGFIIGKKEDKMGVRGSSTTEISLNDVILDEDALLGKVNEGFKLAMKALDGGRVTAAAVSTGIAEHAFEIAKNYANERKTFGKPIGKHQGIMFKIADMASNIYAMKLMMYEAADRKDKTESFTEYSAMAKVFASEKTTQICLDAIQILGGYGYSREYHVERLLRDAKFVEIGEGSSEILRMVIGSKFLTK